MKLFAGSSDPSENRKSCLLKSPLPACLSVYPSALQPAGPCRREPGNWSPDRVSSTLPPNGYADKNWGRDFTSPWVWLSSNCLRSKKTGQLLQDSVFDIGGGRPKIYFVPLDRRLLGVFWYEGKEYDFNFSKLHLLVKTDFSVEEQEDLVVWHVRQENIHAVMETEVFCKKKDMLFVNYEAPDGSKRHNRLWNGGNGWGTVKLYDKKG